VARLSWRRVGAWLGSAGEAWLGSARREWGLLSSAGEEWFREQVPGRGLIGLSCGDQVIASLPSEVRSGWRTVRCVMKDTTGSTRSVTASNALQ